jgi:hypothetical protein
VSVQDHPTAQRPPFLSPAVAPRTPRADDQASPSLGLQVLLFVLAAALSGFTILREISPHDEGLMLQAGSRIAHGQWPYRDFWTNYMPGQPLVLAVLQQIFGASLLAWRVVRTLTDATVALLAYRLARRRAPESYALAAWLAVAGAMAFPTGPGPNPPALALAFGALLAARRRPALGGVLAGIACLFRLEIGVAAIIGVALEAPIGARARSAAIGAGCGVVVLAPFFLAGPGAMWHDTLGFYGIQGLQRLPFPLGFHGPLRPSKLIEFYIPLILVIGLALWALAAALRMGPRPPVYARAALGGGITATIHRPARIDPSSLSLVPLALVGLAYLIGRTDVYHLVPLAAVLPVMLAQAAAAARLAAVRIALLCARPDRPARPGPPRRTAPASAFARRRAGSGGRRRQDGDGRRPSTGVARALYSEADTARRADLCRQPPPRPRHRRRSAPLPDPGTPEPHALRRDATGRGHDRIRATPDCRLVAAVTHEDPDQVARPPRGGDRAQRIGPFERRAHPRSLLGRELPAICP